MQPGFGWAMGDRHVSRVPDDARCIDPARPQGANPPRSGSRCRRRSRHLVADWPQRLAQVERKVGRSARQSAQSSESRRGWAPTQAFDQLGVSEDRKDSEDRDPEDEDESAGASSRLATLNDRGGVPIVVSSGLMRVVARVPTGIDVDDGGVEPANLME